jgi:hypothetical protein
MLFASAPFVSTVRLAENRAVVSWGLFTALTRKQRRATFYTALRNGLISNRPGRQGLGDQS